MAQNEKTRPADGRTEFGLRLEDGLHEALAWKRGEIALPAGPAGRDLEESCGTRAGEDLKNQPGR
jgi:hypothetical protein